MTTDYSLCIAGQTFQWTYY